MDSSARSTVLKRETTLVLTALTFALSFLVIGLPLWWKTTNVYRVSLPYSEIETFPSMQFTHVIPVMVVLADRAIPEGPLWEELTHLSVSEYTSNQHLGLLIHYAWKMRVSVKEEEIMLRHSEDLHELDESLDALNRMEELGVYNILIFNSSIKFPETTRLVGRFRRGYVTSSTDVKLLARNILNVVRKMINADHLRSTFHPPDRTTYYNQKLEKEKMRSLSALTTFDITFSLVVPEPQYINPQWDIEKAIQAYIMPFVQRISKVAYVNIKSQILYVTQFPIKISLKGGNGENYLREDQLPSIINPVEDKLGSYASVHPNLNFIVYVPPKEQSPLHILDERGNLVKTNAFLSPRWGGFYIQNFNVSDADNIPYEPNLDMSATMGVFLAQLKLLLGFPNTDTTKSNIDTFQCPNGCDWELDFVLRKNTQEQLSIAMSSLYSLGRLLQTINNIVIEEDVGKKIYHSLFNIKESVQSLSEGFLEDGAVMAKNAFNSSEEAFFDPSLLALLYFPEDQKYAIYIPLFLPISIPVFMSVKQILNFRTKRAEAKAKRE